MNEEDGRSCCCRVKIWARIILWFWIGIYTSSAITLVILLHFLNTGQFDRQLIAYIESKDDSGLGLYELKTILEISFVSLLMGSLCFVWINGVILGIGIYKEAPGYLRTWVIIHEILFLFLIVGCTVSLVFINFITFIPAIIHMIFVLFSLHVVRSYKNQLIQKNSQIPLLSTDEEVND